MIPHKSDSGNSARTFLFGCMLGSLALVLQVPTAQAQQKSASDKTVNVFNWSDYVDPKVLEDFTKETGIKVVYETYDSNEMLEARLLAGNTGYDVVGPSATFLQRQIEAGVFQPLDKSKLPNAAGLAPDIMKRMSAYDSGNRFAVDYMWFTTGIAYNKKKITERLGAQPIESWDVLFKPELARKIADCGLYVLDSPEDLTSVALNYLKLLPDSRNPNDLRRAMDLLSGVRKYIKKFHSSEYINALANGDICMAIGWSGDSFQAANRAKEVGNGIDIAYVIPREGTLMSLDTLTIPKDAPHADAAHRYIDFMMRPEIAARNSTLTNFASPVTASRALMPPEITGNRAIFPDDAGMKKLFTLTSKDQTTQKFLTREWTRLKTGR